MASQLDYFRAREQQAELARWAEYARQTRDGERSEGAPRGRRLRVFGARLSGAGYRRRGRLQQRELPLPPGGVERSAVSAGCLEVE